MMNVKTKQIVMENSPNTIKTKSTVQPDIDKKFEWPPVNRAGAANVSLAPVPSTTPWVYYVGCVAVV
ncbi:unnamed protein product, partial [Adineta steineri]